jgi:transcriptional regulator with XRE-family HTH domain
MFNYALLVGLRLKNGFDRFTFANFLGISYSHLCKIESGVREPSLDVLRKISECTGVSAGEFLKNSDEKPLFENINSPEEITGVAVLSRDLYKEKFLRKNLEDRVSELERLLTHALAVHEFQEKYIMILRQKLPTTEEAKKIAALARETAKAGELRFDEIQAGLGLTRGTLKDYLRFEKMTYSCKMSPERTAEAFTPGEAGMQLACFDCEAHAQELCRGYGEANYPENFFMLIAMFEAHGIHNREVQARILRDSFDSDISAHKLSEIMSRKKHGKPVPEDIIYLKGTGRA